MTPSELSRRLAERYTAEAKLYQRLWAPVLHPFGRSLIQALPLADAKRILEVGSGTGLLLPEIHLLAPHATIVGIDRSEGMLRLSLRDFAVAVMDAGGIAFKHASFDAALMTFMLFHLPRPIDGLAEVRRVLRPGGSVGTITWGQDPGFPALAVWNEELDRHGAQVLNPALELSQHGFVDTAEKMTELLRRTGYESIRTWTQLCRYQSSPEEFIARRTQMGIDKRRLETLDPPARASCVSRVRERLRRLSGDDFRMRREVIFAIARVSGDAIADCGLRIADCGLRIAE